MLLLYKITIGVRMENISDRRLVIIDSETTGFNFDDGDRIIEIGAIELFDRKPTGRIFHEYVDPEREVPEQAVAVHGWKREDLIAAGKGQKFAHIAQRFFDFVKGSTLIIHNAKFDMSFFDGELAKAGLPILTGNVKTFCTLQYANNIYPGKRNNLDAICRRLGINNSHRELHGALLDSELLKDAYLMMTQHQNTLHFNKAEPERQINVEFEFKRISVPGSERLRVTMPDSSEISHHNNLMSRIDKESGGNNSCPSL